MPSRRLHRLLGLTHLQAAVERGEVDRPGLVKYKASMSLRLMVVGACAALVLTLAAAASAASSSVAKAGCPVVTRAQAAAALGDVKSMEYRVEHIAAAGGGITWLQACLVRLRRGEVQILFSGDDKQSFDDERRGLAESGKVKIVRGLGKAAYLYAPDPADASRDLYVFHPSKASPTPGLPPRPGLGAGAFVIHQVGSGVPVPGLFALARAVLKHPYAPLKKPKQ